MGSCVVSGRAGGQRQQGSGEPHWYFVSSMWWQPHPQGQQREEKEIEASPPPLFLNDLGPVWSIKDVGLDFQFISVIQSCPTLCNPMTRQASLSITNSWSLLQLMSIESVMPSNHLILCHSFLLPPSIFPSIRVFSNESSFTSGGLRSQKSNFEPN